ncbi:MAG: phosphate acyltransferase PlsX [Steroidobacteraceae bacterium]|nr:phosphate acyltransferase PlsX [Nevskiaceae bacterium]
MPVIALDVMSGDVGARESVPAALLALAADPALELRLVGLRDVIEGELAQARATLRAGGDPGRGAGDLRTRLEIVEAAEVVQMHDSPREAIRRKKNSSMRVAIDLVHRGQADAAVSSGNTGALTAIAHFVLKCLPQVERAPIMSAVPNRLGFTHMLDLGANLRASALQLEQFAVMGAIVARDVHGAAAPRVGLLNIGEEEMKGHETIQEAHARLRARVAGMAGGDDPAAFFRYAGFVEGHDIFTGEVDVVVTDGFTGNVALKTMEGVAALITQRMRAEFSATLASKLAALVARPVLKRVGAALDPRRYNGAVMVGLNGVVVKSHGRSDRVAVARAVATAALAVDRGLIQHVSQALGAMPAAGEAGAIDPGVMS